MARSSIALILLSKEKNFAKASTTSWNDFERPRILKYIPMQLMLHL